MQRQLLLQQQLRQKPQQVSKETMQVVFTTEAVVIKAEQLQQEEQK